MLLEELVAFIVREVLYNFHEFWTHTLPHAHFCKQVFSHKAMLAVLHSYFHSLTVSLVTYVLNAVFEITSSFQRKHT